MGNKAIRLKDISGNSIYPCPYFPVGSIYMSVNSTNPSTYFGGTWEQIKDTFLLACGSSYSNGATGGAKSVTSGASSGSTGTPSNNTSGGPSNNTSGSTALTVAQMPAHSHTYVAQPWSFWGRDQAGGNSIKPSENATCDWETGTTSTSGSGQGHTHSLSSHTHSLSSHTHSLNSHTHSVTTMPPYLAVYVWKRTA